MPKVIYEVVSDLAADRTIVRATLARETDWLACEAVLPTRKPTLADPFETRSAYHALEMAAFDAIKAALTGQDRERFVYSGVGRMKRLKPVWIKA